MAAAAVFDVVASNLSPNSLDDAASPCCPDGEIAVAAAAAAAVLPDCFVYLNRWVQTISCASDRVANDQSILSDEYYGEVMLLAFHRLLVAADDRNCNKHAIQK